MKLKVLGSVSPYTREDKNGLGFLITSRNDKILIDAGSGISKNLVFPEDLKNLTIIISHFHRDHYAELLPLSYASYIYHKNGLLENRIKVYIPNDIDSIDKKYIMGLTDDGFYEFITYDENDVLNIGDIKISFKKTVHKVLTFAMKITDGNKTICYSADTGYVNGYLADFVKNADLFICESTFLKNQVKPSDTHLNTEEAGLLAKSACVNKLMLAHFWPDIPKDDYLRECKSVFDNVIVANEKEEFEF